MTRRARNVFPNVPHHVTQRGNFRMDVFHDDEDRRRYLDWLRHYANAYALELWAYCLMPNHVHLIALPHRPDSLARTLGLAHMRYSQYVNRKLNRAGHVWQGRFFSCPMDEAHLLTAARYVERNPVRVGLAERAEEWEWSSAGEHLEGRRLPGAGWPEDELLAGWSELLAEEDDPSELEAIRTQTYTGRPLGDEGFLSRLERWAGKVLRPLPCGRPKKKRKDI
ncbi:MAG: transposase [Planctomycetes bacterium]|nr:transposase [Planctomycetota bacterium]